MFNRNVHAILLNVTESYIDRSSSWTDICKCVVTDSNRSSSWTDICNSVVTDSNSSSSWTDICNSVATDSNSVEW